MQAPQGPSPRPGKIPENRHRRPGKARPGPSIPGNPGNRQKRPHRGTAAMPMRQPDPGPASPGKEIPRGRSPRRTLPQKLALNTTRARKRSPGREKNPVIHVIPLSRPPVLCSKGALFPDNEGDLPSHPGHPQGLRKFPGPLVRARNTNAPGDAKKYLSRERSIYKDEFSEKPRRSGAGDCGNRASTGRLGHADGSTEGEIAIVGGMEVWRPSGLPQGAIWPFWSDAGPGDGCQRREHCWQVQTARF